MIPYDVLVDRLLEANQYIMLMSVAGIGVLAALWVLWGKYEEVMRFLKDDGHLGRMAVWKHTKAQEHAHIAHHQAFGGTVAQCHDKKCKGL